MNLDIAVTELSERIGEQIAEQARALLAQAQAEISRLQEALRQERHLREQAEARVLELSERQQALAEELRLEREGREHADREVRGIHTAIAAQLEIAEAEHAADQAAEAERERRWSQQLEALDSELSQERFWRQLLQQRVENFRTAAADLFAVDPQIPAETIPDTVHHLLGCKAGEVPLGSRPLP